MSESIQTMPNWEKISSMVALVVVITGIIILASDAQYNRLISLLNALSWPLIVLFSVVFFRRIFTYLFLSMDEFNFFGAKGQLRDVQDVISEKVEERRDAEKIEEKRKREFEELEEKAETASHSVEEANALTDEMIELYKEQSDELAEVKKDLLAARKEIEGVALLNKAMSHRAFGHFLNAEAMNDGRSASEVTKRSLFDNNEEAEKE